MQNILDADMYRVFLDQKIGQGRKSSIYTCERKDNNMFPYALCAKIAIIPEEFRENIQSMVQAFEVIRSMNNDYLQQIDKFIYNRNSEGKLQLIIIMEKYETNLKQQMNTYQFNKFELIKFVEDIQNGYKALLTKNIIHGDIRPENIFIKKNQFNTLYKLAYCCVSRMFEKFNHAKVSIYNAPECNLKNDDVTKRKFMIDSTQCQQGFSDVFSLGVILSQLLFQVPNEQTSIDNFYAQLKNQSFQFPFKGLSQMIIQLVHNMLNYWPSKRIPFLEISERIVAIRRNELSMTVQVQQFPQFPVCNQFVKNMPTFIQSGNFQQGGQQQFKPLIQGGQPPVNPNIKSQQFLNNFHTNQQNGIIQNNSLITDNLKSYFEPIVKFLENIKNQSFQLIDKLTLQKIDSALAYFKTDYAKGQGNNLQEYIKQLREFFPYNSNDLNDDCYILFQFSLLQLSKPEQCFIQNQTIPQMKQILDKQ